MDRPFGNTFHTATADHIQGVSRLLHRDPRPQRDLTRRPHPLPGGEDAAADHFVNPRRVNPGLLQVVADGERGQFHRRDRFQGAKKTPHRRTAGRDDIHFIHDYSIT